MYRRNPSQYRWAPGSNRSDEPALHLKRQTQFRDIPWARKGSAGPFLDSAQPVTHGVGMTTKAFSGHAHRGVGLLPCPKGFEEGFALLVGKVGERVQRSADRLGHQI